MNINELDTYELLNQVELKDLNAVGYLLRHKKSGARISIISNDDENKVFYVGFRTPVNDRTGVPHIIEHTVLCGSEQFPVKDPFIELAKGSLNTFLNAMTWPDKTVYPVASCNDTDFQNLMHVYLDAVFYPNIYHYPEIFKQEGWHYELNSKDEPIMINGVVYNEMKGAYSSPESVLDSAIQNSLFPDTTYGCDSGGDPDFIPTLTREEYLDFHRTYYHPSNSYIYLYGDMDPAEKLIWMDEYYLSHFEKMDIDSEIRPQKTFEKPVEKEGYYSISSSESEENNTYLSYNMVIGNALDKQLYIAFEILDYALFGTQGAPVKQALLDAGIGKDVMSYYDNGIYQPIFSIAVKGANASDKDKFVSIIRSVLEEQAANGIDKKALMAGINGSEFKYREADFGRFPRGLMTGLQMLDSWIYDENQPFLHTQESEVYAFLREMVETDYFENLIEKYMLKNTHASVVTILPKIGLNDEKEKKLEEKLQAYKESLSEEQIETLIRETKELAEYQEAPSPKEALETIPLLSRSDLRKDILPLRNDEKEIMGIKTIHHNIESNGIVYLNLMFDVKHIPQDLVPYMGILKNVIGFMDMEDMTYGTFANEINLHTGGISQNIQLYPVCGQKDDYQSKYEIKIKSFFNKTQKALELVEKMLYHTVMTDDKRLQEIITQLKVSMQAYISSSGHTVSATKAMASYLPRARYTDMTQGIEQYKLLEYLAGHFEEEKEDLKKKLSGLCSMIFSADHLMIGCIANEEGYRVSEEALRMLLKSMPKTCVEKKPVQIGCEAAKEGYMDASQILYVGRAGNYSDAGYTYTGTFQVLKTILSYDYLWTQIRVRGGAYGCMSGFTKGGDVFFTSYRDPNLSRTNEVYEKTPEYLEQFDADERDMTKYVIGTFSEMDTPMNPLAKGNRSMNCYLSGITEEMLQKERDEVLKTQPEDIRGLAPAIRAALDPEYLCVIGNEKKIKEEKNLFDKIINLNS